MYSRKSAGPRMDTWGTPALTGCSCEDSPSRATVRVAPDLLKALGILSDTTFRRSAVYREDLKPCWKSEKGRMSLGDQ